MGWDTIYSWSQALAVFFAVVALVSGFVVNKQQSKQLLELEGSVASSKAAQQNVEIDLAEAKTKQSDSERKLLEIQERFTPRTLTGDRLDTFVHAFNNVPRGKVEVSVTTGDPEAFTFATQIRDAFASTGFDVGPQLGSFTLFGAPPVGVLTGILDTGNPPLHAGAVQRAFQSVNIDAPGQSPYGSDPTVVYVRAGIKP